MKLGLNRRNSTFFESIPQPSEFVENLYYLLAKSEQRRCEGLFLLKLEDWVKK